MESAAASFGVRSFFAFALPANEPSAASLTAAGFEPVDLPPGPDSFPVFHRGRGPCSKELVAERLAALRG